MTVRQIALVQDSFQLLRPQQEIAARLFYTRLFEIEPELRALFKSDLNAQGQKLMATLAFAVNSLHTPGVLLEKVGELGVRHTGYGVQDADYAPVGAALLWTLEKGLGGSFTAEVREAWAATYTLLSDTMRDAAARVAA